MNSDEQVWNQAKTEVGKRAIRSKHEMETAILAALQGIQQQAERVKGFFGLPDMLYAQGYD